MAKNFRYIELQSTSEFGLERLVVKGNSEGLLSLSMLEIITPQMKAAGAEADDEHIDIGLSDAREVARLLIAALDYLEDLPPGSQEERQ